MTPTQNSTCSQATTRPTRWACRALDVTPPRTNATLMLSTSTRKQHRMVTKRCKPGLRNGAVRVTSCCTSTARPSASSTCSMGLGAATTRIPANTSRSSSSTQPNHRKPLRYGAVRAEQTMATPEGLVVSVSLGVHAAPPHIPTRGTTRIRATAGTAVRLPLHKW